MGKLYEEITPKLAGWLLEQKIFFVATAPLAAEGLINCSPKGWDTFRILGPREVAYLDLTGSGIETVAHLRENGRIVFMFCAFSGSPRILRLHGIGQVVTPDEPSYSAFADSFPSLPGARAVIRVRVDRISDSCGYFVPRFEFVEDRDTGLRWAEAKGPAGLAQYRHDENRRSLDGLQGLESRE